MIQRTKKDEFKLKLTEKINQIKIKSNHCFELFENIILKTMITAISFSLAIGPTAIAKSSSSGSLYDSVKSQLVVQGLDKKNQPVADWFKKLKPNLDPEDAMKFEYWTKNHIKEVTPDVEITKGKTTDDLEIVHIKLKKEKKEFKFDIVKNGDNVYLEQNGKKYNVAEFYFGQLVNNLTDYHFPFYTTHKILSVYQKYPNTAIKYFTALRDYLIVLEKHQTVFMQGNFSPTKLNKKYSMLENLIDFSYAMDSNKQCLIAGWLGNLDKNGNCSVENTLATLKCDKNMVRCSQFFFGRKENENDPSGCVSNVPSEKVTSSYCMNDPASDPKKILARYENSSENLVNDKLFSDQTKKVFEVCYGINKDDQKQFNLKIKDMKENKSTYEALEASSFIQQFATIPNSKKNKSCSGSAAKDCNEHNRIACAETIKQIARLVNTNLDIPPKTPVAKVPSTETPSEGKNPTVDEILDKAKTEPPISESLKTDEECSGFWGCIADNPWKSTGIVLGAVGAGVGLGYLLFHEKEVNNINMVAPCFTYVPTAITPLQEPGSSRPAGFGAQ